MYLIRARINLLAVLVLLIAAEINARPHIDKVLKENGFSSTEKEDEGLIKFTKQPPESIIYEIGSVGEVECEAIGSSDLSVQWVPGDMAEIDVLNNFTPNPATIVKIRSVLVVEHLKQKETFSCIATSLHTGKQIIAKTTVIPMSSNNVPQQDELAVRKRNHRSPKIIQNYSLFMGEIGSSIILPCQTKRSGHQHKVKKYWIDFNNNVIDEANERFTLTQNGDLIISDLEWKDMGLYKCVAENSHGKDSANTFVYPVLDDCKSD